MSVHIRPYLPDDAPAYYEAARESIRELQPWMPWCHPGFTLTDATAWTLRQVTTFAERWELEFLIVDERGALLGACGLNAIDTANRRANMGYWVRSSVAGKGIATEAVRQLVRWAHENTDLHRIEVVIAVENVPSIRVAEKAGARREAVLRSRLLLHDVFHEAVMFTFIRGENMG